MSAAIRAVAGVGALGAACVAYGTFVERRWYRVRRIALPSIGPGSGDVMGTDAPVRVLHLSDIHYDPPEPELDAFFDQLAELWDDPASRPDVVVITGDLLGWPGAEQPVVDTLRRFTADGTPGLVVYGSNDVFGPTPKNPLLYITDPDARKHGTRLDTASLTESLEKTGWHVLGNERLDVTLRDGRTVAVAALEDPHLAESVIPPLEAIDIRDRTDASLRLGLCHAPYTAALDRLVEAGCDLLLSGHTHGGQVRFPPIGAVVANCDLPLDQVRGASRYRGANLHVSPGLGTSRYAPFRFACRPEAALLTLV